MAAVGEGLEEVDETFERDHGVLSPMPRLRGGMPVDGPVRSAPWKVPGPRSLHSSRGAQRTVRRFGVGKVLGSRGALKAATAGAAVAQRIKIDRILPGPLGRMRGLRPLPIRPPSIVGEVRAPDGPPIGRAAVLAGCVMDQWFSPVHEATLELLRRGGYLVEVPAAQTCCGALAAHDGAVAGCE